MPRDEKDLLWDNTRNFNISLNRYKRAYYNMSELHYHKHYEILLVFENERVLLTTGDKAPLNKNNILLMPPFILHRTISGDKPFQRNYLINFTSDLADKIKSVINIDVRLLFNTSNFTHTLSDESSAFIYELTSEMYKEKQKGGIVGEALAFLHLCRLLIELYSLTPRKSDSFKYNKTLSDIIYYFEEHYSEDITADLISDKFAISRYSLPRLFKKHTGVTMVQYLNNIRISKAKQLLENGNHSITKIASLTGYNSSSAFALVFKKIMGISPQNYRKMFIAQQKSEEK